jgi:DNA-binding phage protein
MLTPEDIALKRRQLATLRARANPTTEAIAAIARLESEVAEPDPLSAKPDIHAHLAAVLGERDAALATITALRTDLDAAQQVAESFRLERDQLRRQLDAKAKPAAKRKQ